VKTASVLK